MSKEVSVPPAIRNLREALGEINVEASRELRTEPKRQEAILSFIKALEDSGVTDQLDNPGVEAILPELGRTKKNKPIRGISIWMSTSDDERVRWLLAWTKQGIMLCSSPVGAKRFNSIRPARKSPDLFKAFTPDISAERFKAMVVTAANDFLEKIRKISIVG